MASVFLSYAREDRGCAEKLAQMLEGAGHSVWWDRRIDGGEEFGAEIEAELDKSDVVVVAWSKDSVKSRWVRDEAAVGGDRGILVPVTIDGSLPPMGFRQFHTLDLADWRGGKRDERTAELLRSVERRVKGKGKAPPAAEPKPNRRFVLPAGKSMWAMATALVLIVAVGAALLLFLTGRDISDGPLKPTIGLLPFTTASPDAELRQLGSQARDSLAHTFSQSGVPVRLLNAPPSNGPGSVDFFISGDLSRSGDKILATVRLNETSEGITVFSDRIEASREDARNLPERIGAQTAGNLTWSEPLSLLDRRDPLDPVLLAELLRGHDFTDFIGDQLKAYQDSKRIAAKAPNVRSAQTGQAFGTAFVLGLLPRDERAEAVAEARRAADRALSLDPGVGDTYGAWCYLHSETRMAECEDRLRAGKQADPDASFLNTFLNHHLRAVGRFDEALALARLAHSRDTYVPTKIAWMLRMLEYAGDGDGARELHDQGVRWWPEYKYMFARNRLLGLIARGDFEAMQRVEQEVGAKDLIPGYATTGALAAALKAKSVAAVKLACRDTDGELLKIRCMLALAMLGDQDGAYAIADTLYPRRVGRTPAETERIWLDEPDGAGGLEFITSPAAAPMRRDPRYLALAERTGLLAYWRSGRLPDFCRKDPEPICRQIRNRA